MSEAREQIFGTIRRNLKREALGSEQRGELERRLNQPIANLVPARAQLPQPELVELFVKMAQEAAAGVSRVASMDAVPAAVSTMLREQKLLPMEIVLAPSESVQNLPWADQPELSTQSRKAQNGDKVCVSPAFAGIAETGTLMLLSGPDSPTTLNFLPDIHIVVLTEDRIVGPYEDAWAKLRECAQGMPRTVNFITGPSRSADIEQTLQMGAHGPIQLHIVLVGKT